MKDKPLITKNVNLNAIPLRREIKNGCEVTMRYELNRADLIHPVVPACEFYIKGKRLGPMIALSNCMMSPVCVAPVKSVREVKFKPM